MNRRQLLKLSVSTGVMISLGAGYAWLKDGTGNLDLTIDIALKKLDALEGKTIISRGEWDAAQIFNHAAQSVEYSMLGYPQHRSELFKNTVGKAVFSVFESKGYMKHGLNEPIPGAPELILNQNTQIGVDRVRTSLIDFEQFTGDLAPHFVYGKLTKEEYTLAHVMHLYNHLTEISAI